MLFIRYRTGMAKSNFRSRLAQPALVAEKREVAWGSLKERHFKRRVEPSRRRTGFRGCVST